MGKNCAIFRDLMFFGLIVFAFNLKAQTLQTGQEIRYNPISTAVPFLTITPDSRHGAMGNVGVATSPDANSEYLNPSKYAFTEEKYGFSVSYTPWLRKLVHDINLTYLSGFYRIDNEQVIGSSFRYFSMGDVSYADITGSTSVTVRPNEFAPGFQLFTKTFRLFFPEELHFAISELPFLRDLVRSHFHQGMLLPPISLSFTVNHGMVPDNQ